MEDKKKAGHQSDLIDDAAAKTLFHHTLVFLDKWAKKPAWSVILIVLLLIVLVGLFWLTATGQPAISLISAGLLVLFLGADFIIFRLLPAMRISYGSWKSQLIVMLFPRTAISVVIAAFAFFLESLPLVLIMAGLQLCLSFVLVWGSFFEVRRLELNHERIGLPAYGSKRRPIQILQMSDLHIERCTSREENLIQMAADTKADIIVLTGDYLNLSYVGDDTAQTEVKRMLSQLKAPGGVYAVLGGPTVDDRRVVPDLFEDLPIHLLINEWAEVTLDDSSSVILLGLDCTQDLEVDKDNLLNLVGSSPNSSPRVLLYHTPDLMPDASKLDIDLYLSGHTHGGQVRLPLYGAILTSSKLGKRYEMGRYDEEGTTLYVSRGVGLEGLGAPRMRFLSPPEITMFTLYDVDGYDLR